MSGVNQEAFSASEQPSAQMGAGAPVAMQHPPSEERHEPSLIPGYMLSEQQRRVALASTGSMQTVLGLTPEQEAMRLKRFELELQAQRESRKFWFCVLTASGSIVTALIVGLVAVFQFSPSNRANSYAAMAESIGRPEIRIDCGFRLAGECEAGQIAERALETFDDRQQRLPDSLGQAEAMHAPKTVPLQPQRYPDRLGTAVVLAADPRQSSDYQRSYETIHQWSQRGYGSDVIAGHYYWLEQAQRNPTSSEHQKAMREPSHVSYKLAFEDYYKLRL